MEKDQRLICPHCDGEGSHFVQHEDDEGVSHFGSYDCSWCRGSGEHTFDLDESNISDTGIGFLTD